MCFAFGFVRRCGSVAGIGLWFTPVFFPLSGKKRRLAVSCVPVPPGRDRLRAFSRCRCGCRAWRERGAGLRGRCAFCRGVWRSECVCPRGSVAAFAFGLRLPSRLCCRVCLRFTPVFFPLSGKKRRLAVSCVPIPPGRDRHSCVFAVSVRLSAFVGSLRVWPFLYGDLDGVTGVRRTGIRGWRRGDCALLRSRIGVAALSAGSTLGLRAPNLRQRVFDSLDSLQGLAEWQSALYAAVGTYSRPLRIFTQSHWHCEFFRGEYAGAARPKPAPKSRMWKRHCRLSGLSSRCGGVALVQIRRACAFLRKHIGLVMLSAGSTLGLRAPDCAKESSTLWTLFTLRRGCVGANSRRRHPGTRKDPPDSDLWPGGSGCIAITSTRTIGDLPDSDLWSGRSCCIARQQVSAGTAGRVSGLGCRAQPCLETLSMLRRTASSVA